MLLWPSGLACRYVSERHCSVGSVADMRTWGRWFDPRLGQYSFQELMIVIVTGFIPLSQLSVVSTMAMWESSQWLGKNIVRSTGQKNSRKARMGALAAAILLKYHTIHRSIMIWRLSSYNASRRHFKPLFPEHCSCTYMYQLYVCLHRYLLQLLVWFVY